MRCGTCATGCGASTTSSREGEGNEHEMEMGLPGPAGRPGDPALRRPRRRDREAAVELGAPPALRLAPDQLLAGARAAGPVPDPVRRPGVPRVPGLAGPASPGRALEGAMEGHAPRAAGAPP